MMKLLFAAFSVMLMAMASAPPPQAQITEERIVVVDQVLNPEAPHNIERHYRLFDGRQYCAPGVAPRIVIAFHGGHGDAKKMSDEMLTPPKGCYAVAWPYGSNRGWDGIRVSGTNLTWNTGSPLYNRVGGGEWAEEAGVNDDLFITSLVNHLKGQFGAQTAFAVGVSRGGMMAFHYACDTNLFAAMATVATTVTDDTCNPPTRIPDLHIHGRSDDLVCWETMVDSCRPWPVAKVEVWQKWQAAGQAGGHKLILVLRGEHAWDMKVGNPTTQQIWDWLDQRPPT